MPRKIYAILLACLLVLVATGKAMAANPLSLIDTCLSRLQKVEQATDRSEAVTLSDSCPELSLELGNQQLAQLEPTLEDKTTLGQLTDVQRSLRSLQSGPENQHTITLNNLQQILKQTYIPEKKTKALENPVDKLLDWVGKKIRDYFKQDNWITRHFNVDSKMSKNTIKGIFNVLVVLLVVIVLFIVVNELRAASVFSLFQRRRRARTHLQDLSEQQQDLSRVSLRHISELPLNIQVPALLRYTLQQLIDRQVLPHRYNLTNQEFLGILRQKLPEAGQDFEQLVNSSDRVMYGNKLIANAEADQLLDRAHHIEQLQGNVKP